MFDPPVLGIISDGIIYNEKSSMLVIREQITGELDGEPFISVRTSSRQISGDSLYPMEIGDRVTVSRTQTITTTAMGETHTETTTEEYIVRVETVERITVLAGTFECFRVAKCDRDGVVTETNWLSDEVKQGLVKGVRHESGDTSQLLSYSLR
jgi:hypothetical protein